MMIDIKCNVSTGGHDDMSYMIYYREHGSGKRFTKAHSNADGLELTVFRLAASTVYDMVGVSMLVGDENPLTSGELNIADSSIVLDENVASDIVRNGFFEYCVSSVSLYFRDFRASISNRTVMIAGLDFRG